MTLKTMAKRLTGGDVEAAAPATETVEELAAALAGPTLRISAILTAAQDVSGQVVRNFGEWDAMTHLLYGRRAKQLLADGASEFQASKQAAEELEATRQELTRLAIEVKELTARLAAAYETERGGSPGQVGRRVP